MSQTERLNGELHAVSEGLAVAMHSATAATATAEAIARQCATSGFTAIAQQMARVQQIVQEARTQLTAAADAAGQTRTAAAAVPQQASPQETITALTPLLERLSAIDASIAAARESTGTARHLAATALQGGQPERILAALDRIVQTTQAVGQRTATGRQHVQDAITAARQAGTAGN